MAFTKKCFSNFRSTVTEDDIIRSCHKVRNEEPNLRLACSSAIGSFWYQVAQKLAQECGGLTALKRKDLMKLATTVRWRCCHSSELRERVSDMFNIEGSLQQISDSSEASVKLNKATAVDLRNEDIPEESTEELQAAADFTENGTVSGTVSSHKISVSVKYPLNLRQPTAVEKPVHDDGCLQRPSYSSLQASLPFSDVGSSHQSIDSSKDPFHLTDANSLVAQREYVNKSSYHSMLDAVNCTKKFPISDTLSSKLSEYITETQFQFNESCQSAVVDAKIRDFTSACSASLSAQTRDLGKDSFQSKQTSAVNLTKEYDVYKNSLQSTVLGANANSFQELVHKNPVLDIDHPVDLSSKPITVKGIQSAHEETCATVSSTCCPVFLNKVECLSANECSNILKNTSPLLYSSLPPLKPKNGDIFLFSNNDSSRDWRADQMGLRFVSRNLHRTLGGTVMKYKYSDQDDSKGQPATCFKFAFCLDGDTDNRWVIQYLGKPEAIALRPHGNAKTTNQSAAPRHFFATAPSVMKEIKENMDKSASKIYSDFLQKRVPQGYDPALRPRSTKQIRNAQFREKEKSKICHDDVFAVVELERLYEGFVLEIEILHDFYCILANEDILADVDSCWFESSAYFCCDTTFEFGDFYVTTLVFSHPYFTNAHIIPVFMMLHHKRTQQTHDAFFEALAKRCPAWNSARCKIVTDREKAITCAIDKYFPNITRLLCWNHIRRDIDAWVKKHVVASGEDRRATIVSYSSSVMSLLNSTSEQEYSDNLKEFAAHWDEEFLDYYTGYLQQDIEKHAGRWILEPCSMFTDPSGITTNNSESFHSFLHHYMDRKECSMEHFVSKMYVMMSEFHSKILLGLCNRGDYQLRSHLIPNDPATLSLPDMPFTMKNLSIIARERRAEMKKTSDDVERDLQPRLTRAKALVASPGGVVLIPEQGIFTVKGYSGKVYTVRLHPKVSCSCPAARKCDHIMACELATGQEILEDVKVGKLSALLKRKRGRSGRKFTTNSALTYVNDPDSSETMPRVGILSSQIKAGYSARQAKQVSIVEVDPEVVVESNTPKACRVKKTAVARGRPKKANRQENKCYVTRQEAFSSPICQDLDQDYDLPDISSIGHSPSTKPPSETFVDLCEDDEGGHGMQWCSSVDMDQMQNLASSASHQQVVNSIPSENITNSEAVRLKESCKSMFSQNDFEEIFPTEKELKINGETVRYINSKTLAPREWLDETIINSFLALQCHKLEKSDAFLTMTYIPICRFKTFKQNYDSPSPLFLQFLKTNNIWFHDVILVPIDRNNNHWLLALIVPKQRRIYYLDSLFPNVDHRTVVALEVLVQILAYVSNDTCDINLWTFLQPHDIRKQQNDYDCGVYVCMWAYFVATSETAMSETATSETMHVNDRKAYLFREIMQSEILLAEADGAVKIHKEPKPNQPHPSLPESLMTRFLKGHAHRISNHTFYTLEFLADLKHTISEGSDSCCFAKESCCFAKKDPKEEPNFTLDSSSLMNETVAGRNATMVFCTYQCRDWYHRRCEGISQEEISLTENYKCRKCTLATQDANKIDKFIAGPVGAAKVLLNPWKSMLKDIEAASSWLERNEDILHGIAVAPNMKLLSEEEVSSLTNLAKNFYKGNISTEQDDFMIEKLSFKFSDARDRLLFKQIMVTKGYRTVLINPQLYDL